MRALTIIVVLTSLWFAGCSIRHGTATRELRTHPRDSQFGYGGNVTVTNAPSPYGEYDREFIACVSQRWNDLLDARNYAGYRTGTVAVVFKLHADGLITDLKVKTNNVSKDLGWLCQKAVLDPAPYKPWPREMRLKVGEDYRQITFSFYYK